MLSCGDWAYYVMELYKLNGQAYIVTDHLPRSKYWCQVQTSWSDQFEHYSSTHVRYLLTFVSSLSPGVNHEVYADHQFRSRYGNCETAMISAMSTQ